MPKYAKRKLSIYFFCVLAAPLTLFTNYFIFDYSRAISETGKKEGSIPETKYVHHQSRNHTTQFGTASNLFTVLETIGWNVSDSLQNFLVVSVANLAEFDLIMNWHTSFFLRRNVTSKYLIVCLDWALYKRLKQKKISCIHVLQLINISNVPRDIEDEHKFGSHLYYELHIIKSKIIYSLLKDYKLSVIYTDMDIVWLHDSIEDYIKSEIKRNNLDILFAHEYPNHHHVCGGFYAMKSSTFALEYMENTIAYAESHKLYDQTTFNYLLQNYTAASDVRRIGLLDWLLFPNGYVIMNGYNSRFHVQYWIIHANWVVGRKEKVKFLKSYNYWYINDTDMINE